MSKNLIENRIDEYDWISWPDQDEFLEGPDRSKSYYEWNTEVYNSKYNYIEFNNYVYWYSENDDTSIETVKERMKYFHYFVNVHHV